MHSIPKVGGGLRKRKYIDKRNYDYIRTFGAAIVFHEELHLDVGLTNPNQNEPDPYFGNPPFPEGCTAFTTCDIATDQDGIIYDPKFTLEKTALVAGVPGYGPFTIKDSMISATDYGLRAKGEDDQQALAHRRAPYFEIRPNGLAWATALRTPLQQRRTSLSVGVPWCMEFTIAKDGVIDKIPATLRKDSQKKGWGWHDMKVCGWEPRKGRLYLETKIWAGPNHGDNGFYYFSEEAINSLMDIPGTGAFTNAHAEKKDIQTVRLTIAQTLLQYYFRLMKLMAELAASKSSVVALEAPKTPSEPSLPPSTPSMPTVGINDLYEDWSKPRNAWHNVRVLCDRAGLSLSEKSLICACIYQESTFLNSAIGRNKNSAGKTTSTDWGLCQINDFYNIGPGKPFPSVEYVVNNPQKAVEWMIQMYQAGKLSLWSSYKFGAYKKWLKPDSPMWLLANK